jgi:ATP-binding cassette subfamily F protein uup
LLRNELAWIRRGAKARSTKQKARIDRFENLKESAQEINEERLEISVASSRLGKKVIELKNISKAFDHREVIHDFSYTVLRGDRVGIIGPNGSGKSTLINLLAGVLQPDHGKIEVGETVKIGMFAQETSHMDDNLRVIEYIREGAEYVGTADGEKISASQMLERFLFPSALQWTPIGRLSGGEKRRLHLLRILMEAPNVLLLDEPTNDLDIETLTILEDYLEHFSGAVMAVSHDRYFLDKMADKIFAFKGKGRIQQYTGNYSGYKESNNDEEENRAVEKDTVNRKEDLSSKGDRGKEKEKPLKFSFKEQREYEEIDVVIAGLEEKILETEEKLNDAATDYTLLQQLTAEKEGLEKQLEEKMERWMYLNELAEKIEKK